MAMEAWLKTTRANARSLNAGKTAGTGPARPEHILINADLLDMRPSDDRTAGCPDPPGGKPGFMAPATDMPTSGSQTSIRPETPYAATAPNGRQTCIDRGSLPL